MNTLYSILILCLTCCCSSAQSNEGEKQFEVEELKEDFDYLRNLLEKKNATLYLHHSKVEVNHFLDSLYSLLVHPMTEREFYVTIAPIAAYLGDGHFWVLPSSEFSERVNNATSMLPLDIQWIKSKAYVSFNHAINSDIQIGTEVMSIDGIPLSEIEQKLLELMPNSGSNNEYAKYVLNRRFWYYYNAVYSSKSAYSVQYVDELGERVTKKLQGMNVVAMDSIREKAPISNRREYGGIELQFIDSNQLAILSIPTFGKNTLRYWSGQWFKQEIRRSFRSISAHKTEKLIIDIRDNGGGNPPCSHYVLRYLLEQQTRQTLQFRIVKHSDRENYLDRTKRLRAPFFGLRRIRPRKKRFTGEVMLLVNGETGSTSAIFSNALVKMNRAKVYGSETGENPHLMTGHYFRSTRYLPNTNLHVSPGTVSVMQANMNEYKNQGIIPDVKFERSLKDLTEKGDRWLKQLIELAIEEGKINGESKK